MTEIYQVTGAEPAPYFASDPTELAEFLILSGNLAEVDNLAGHPETQQSQAEDIAGKIFRHGISARILADMYETERIAQLYGCPETANVLDEEEPSTLLAQREVAYA